MRVQVIRAWPHRFDSIEVEVPDGARVIDALAASGWSDAVEADGHAIFGVNVTPDTVLNEGDRIELLRPLQMDPKEARRRRALR